MNTEVEKIVAILKRELPNLQADFGVETLALFGSYLRQEQKKTSDVDLLVSFRITPSLLTFVELELHLSDLIQKKVDPVMKKSLKTHIGKRLLAQTREIV